MRDYWDGHFVMFVVENAYMTQREARVIVCEDPKQNGTLKPGRTFSFSTTSQFHTLLMRPA